MKIFEIATVEKFFFISLKQAARQHLGIKCLWSIFNSSQQSTNCQKLWYLLIYRVTVVKTKDRNIVFSLEHHRFPGFPVFVKVLWYELYQKWWVSQLNFFLFAEGFSKDWFINLTPVNFLDK